MSEPILAITSGEPAGIGIDICLDLVNEPLPCRVAILGDIHLFKTRARMLGKNIQIRPFNPQQKKEQRTLDILHIPLRDTCITGKLNPNNVPYVIDLLDQAYNGIIHQQFVAMVTCPIHKGVINDFSGSLKFFSGHTEYLAEKSNTSQVVMMLANHHMRVALLTTHLPLRAVADSITADLITHVATILHHDLQNKFGISSPKILLAGLNPHAGESGHLGNEECHIMLPCVQMLREKGINITNPLPADTLFQPFYLSQADVVLAAYHDQGLPVLKYAGFGDSVNITLGLPFIRTSVDHGTALDLAGTGKAHSGSLKTAIKIAWEMVQNTTTTNTRTNINNFD